MESSDSKMDSGDRHEERQAGLMLSPSPPVLETTRDLPVVVVIVVGLPGYTSRWCFSSVLVVNQSQHPLSSAPNARRR